MPSRRLPRREPIVATATDPAVLVIPCFAIALKHRMPALCALGGRQWLTIVDGQHIQWLVAGWLNDQHGAHVPISADVSIFSRTTSVKLAADELVVISENQKMENDFLQLECMVSSLLRKWVKQITNIRANLKCAKRGQSADDVGVVANGWFASCLCLQIFSNYHFNIII